MRTCVVSSKKQHIKVKTEMIIESFLERNKEYMIEIYIINAENDIVMSLLYIPIERNIDKDENGITITWKTKDIEWNHCSLLYDEMMDCYEELIESKFQAVSAILKNGMKFQFECTGIRA